jgi:serine phosphatase RsbU (regulator of sigma subunit)/predicted negative regulator of RcsB-dependent stress response
VRKRHIYTAFIFLAAIKIFAQDAFMDTIQAKFKRANDTNKVYLLCTLSKHFEANDPNKGMWYADSAIKLAKRSGFRLGVGGAYGCKGSCLTTLGRYDEAITALLEGLRVFEQEKNKRYTTNSYNTIGNAYMGMGLNEKAYEYFEKGYKMAGEKPVDLFMKAVTAIGLANVILKKNEFDKAIGYYKESAAFFHEQKDVDREAVCLTMLGETCVRKKDSKQARGYFEKTLEMFKEAKNDYGYASSLSMLAGIYYDEGNMKKAAQLYEECYEVNKRRGGIDDLKDNTRSLAMVYEAMKVPGEALKFYKEFMHYKDSVINKERNKSIAESEAKYQSEKKEQELKLKNSELEKSQLKVDQRNHLIYVFAAASVVFVVLLFLVFRQFRQKKKANVLLVNKNDEIEKKNHLIEEKNKDITDSINYSKHIQQAILPMSKKIKFHLPHSFVLFKPKDIVSGDFYLVEEVVGLVYIAAVDCTGHGVPGAMLSVFANSTIKNTIASNDFRDNPAAVLSDLCFSFKSNLITEKANVSIRDGVDMSLCMLDKRNKKLYFAGARNNLLMLRDGQMTEFAADRWGISGTNTGEQLFFTNHIIDLQAGDKFYMTTDGYSDQFGGPNGKKLKQKQLKDFLMRYVSKPFDEQAQILSEEFEKWKGKLEQIDDVTIIGFGV